ncbi:50S ribosomal protein L6 [Coprothermobacteraceae bacterium]|nr:50S ribosomal protein L6 [Coprothermobacteraceae bacterium]
MSRIGRKPVSIPKGVEVTIEGNTVTVKGPKGQLTRSFDPRLEIVIEDGQVLVKRTSEEKEVRALHGTTRALLQNMITGVSEGFSVVLKIKGIGYRAEMKGNDLQMSLGYSHPVFVKAPEGVKFAVPAADTVVVSGIDKEVVTQTAANIRRWREPDAYKGKGIWYEGEQRTLKPGKAVGKGK